MPKSKPPRKKRRVLNNRDRVALFVRRRDRAGLEQWLALAAATGRIGMNDRKHIEQLLTEEVSKASPETRMWWSQSRCVCGEPEGHVVDSARLYEYEGRMLHHDEVLAAYARAGEAVADA